MMMTPFRPALRQPAAMQSVHFEAKKTSQPVKIEGAISYIDTSDFEGKAEVKMITNPAALTQLIGQIPSPPVYMYQPAKPLDVSKKVGFLVKATSAAGSEDLHSPKITVDSTKKTINVSMKQNRCDGGVAAVKTANAFMYTDKANLPKGFQSYDLKLKVKKEA